MASDELICAVREMRTAAGLSQKALAEQVGVSRQAIVAIESSAQVPSTALALRLSRALGTSVEELFRLAGPERVRATTQASLTAGTRTTMGRVDGRWVAHSSSGADSPSDGIVCGGDDGDVWIEPVAPLSDVENNLLVAGCAPLLGNLSARVDRRYSDARATWIGAGSGRALDLLDAGLVHIAGLHLGGATGREHGEIAKRRVAGDPFLVVNLAVWRQGLAVRPGNPLSIQSIADLEREDVRTANREQGSGASELLRRLLGRTPACVGPLAADHEQVAQMVQWGMADVGVTIESVAIAHGLTFLPLSDERFDLVIPERHLDLHPVARFLDALVAAEFRRDAERLPGYDLGSVGDSTRIER